MEARSRVVYGFGNAWQGRVGESKAVFVFNRESGARNLRYHYLRSARSGTKFDVTYIRHSTNAVIRRKMRLSRGISSFPVFRTRVNRKNCLSQIWSFWRWLATSVIWKIHWWEIGSSVELGQAASAWRSRPPQRSKHWSTTMPWYLQGS